jgi:hypothetical protein
VRRKTQKGRGLKGSGPSDSGARIAIPQEETFRDPRLMRQLISTDQLFAGVEQIAVLASL